MSTPHLQPQTSANAAHLIETMRGEAGNIHRLDAHLARLRASAHALGFQCDLSTMARAATDALAHATRANPSTPVWRVRLALYTDGTLDARVVALTPDPSATVVWSAHAIDEDSLARRHKSSDRALYDHATRFAQTHGMADVIFLNQRGHVAEGAISNVFVRGVDGVLATPPVAAGALPGVLRAALLASGEAIERTLTPAMLHEGELLIGNALRGLRAVTLVNAPTFTLPPA